MGVSYEECVSARVESEEVSVCGGQDGEPVHFILSVRDGGGWIAIRSVLEMLSELRRDTWSTDRATPFHVPEPCPMMQSPLTSSRSIPQALSIPSVFTLPRISISVTMKQPNQYAPFHPLQLELPASRSAKFPDSRTASLCHVMRFIHSLNLVHKHAHQTSCLTPHPPNHQARPEDSTAAERQELAEASDGQGSVTALDALESSYAPPVVPTSAGQGSSTEAAELRQTSNLYQRTKSLRQVGRRGRVTLARELNEEAAAAPNRPSASPQASLG